MGDTEEGSSMSDEGKRRPDYQIKGKGSFLFWVPSQSAQSEILIGEIPNKGFFVLIYMKYPIELFG